MTSEDKRRPSEIIRERAMQRWLNQPMHSVHIGDFQSAHHEAIRPKSLTDFIAEATLEYLDEQHQKGGSSI